MSEPAILDVQNLHAAYGRSPVLFNVSLLAPRTGTVAILGRNGAGKTTLMKAIMGEMEVPEGRIFFDGGEATTLPTEARVLAGIGYVPQEHAVFAKLSVRENLEIGALKRRNRAGIERVLAIFPKLGQRLPQLAGTLSGGERKMLAICRALLGQPRLLLLDEPTEGVWIGVIEEIAETLERLSREIAVVLVEQHVELALRLARYAYVMDRGRIALEGPSAQVRADPRLLRYLAP